MATKKVDAMSPEEVADLVVLAELETQTHLSERLKHEAELTRLKVETQRMKLIASQEEYLAGDGTYYFNHYVGKKSIREVLRRIKLWHDNDPDQPWRFVVNSGGGDVFDGAALVDTLTTHSLRGGGTHEITCHVAGFAASMAAHIIQAADIRTMGQTAWMMFHQPAAITWGTLDEIADEAAWMKRIYMRDVEMVSERSNGLLTAAQYKRKTSRRDWWVDDREALKFGLIDEVV